MLQVDVLNRDVRCRVIGGCDRNGAVGSNIGIPIGKGRIVISYGIVVLGNGLPLSEALTMTSPSSIYQVAA